MVVLPVPSALGKTSVCSLSLIWMMSPCSGHGFSAGIGGSETRVVVNFITVVLKMDQSFHTSGSCHEAQDERLLWSGDLVGRLEHLLSRVHLVPLVNRDKEIIIT